MYKSPVCCITIKLKFGYGRLDWRISQRKWMVAAIVPAGVVTVL